MKNGYIALLDSGIGGISVLNELIKIMPYEKYLYLGDNNNAPYGNKSLLELKALTFKNIDYLKRYNIKVLVVACNTLSVNLLEDIRAYSGLSVFGVFPPIEKALIENKNCLLLATSKTAEKYANVKGLTVVGLKDLAEDIEKNISRIEKVPVLLNLMESQDKFIIRPHYYEAIILGCTHYNFVKNKIIDHLKPQKIIVGEYFTAKMIKNFLIEAKSLVKYSKKQVLFIGDCAKKNEEFFKFGGRDVLK